jgi:dihydrofolate reductase
MTINLSLIAALDRGHAIGRQGTLPWHLPEDLKRFKRLTLGKPVLMGRKTAIAIGRALPGRKNLVLSRAAQAPFDDQQRVASVSEAIDLAGESELMVIGGGEVYALTLPLATRLYLTWVQTQLVDADAWFPAFAVSGWKETGRVSEAADAKHAFAFDFVDYQRIPS